jgi:hypothetical protein
MPDKALTGHLYRKLNRPNWPHPGPFCKQEPINVILDREWFLFPSERTRKTNETSGINCYFAIGKFPVLREFWARYPLVGLRQDNNDANRWKIDEIPAAISC